LYVLYAIGVRVFWREVAGLRVSFQLEFVEPTAGTSEGGFFVSGWGAVAKW
jgi:hypothetical protein